MIHRASEIGIRESDAAKRSGAQNFPGRGIAISAKEKTRLRTEIRMPPPIENDSGNIALWVESNRRKHLRQLFANAVFVCVERSGQHFSAAAMALRFR